MNSQNKNNDVAVAVAWNIAQVEIGHWRIISRLDGAIGEGTWRIEYFRRDNAESPPVAAVSEMVIGADSVPLRRLFVIDATLDDFEFRFDAGHSPVSCHITGNSRSNTLQIALCVDSEIDRHASITIARDSAFVDIRPVHGTIAVEGDSVRLSAAEPIVRSGTIPSGPRYVIGAVDVALRADH